MVPENKIIISDLTEHFKSLMAMFKAHGVRNVVTDYPNMHNRLLRKYGIDKHDLKNNYSNILYHRLTHEVIPTLEKKKILKRYRLFDGKWVFVINKRLKMFK